MFLKPPKFQSLLSRQVQSPGCCTALCKKEQPTEVTNRSECAESQKLCGVFECGAKSFTPAPALTMCQLAKGRTKAMCPEHGKKGWVRNSNFMVQPAHLATQPFIHALLHVSTQQKHEHQRRLPQFQVQATFIHISGFLFNNKNTATRLSMGYITISLTMHELSECSLSKKNFPYTESTNWH